MKNSNRNTAARRSLIAGGMLIAASGALAQGKSDGVDKVVYHIDNGTTQATKGLRNVRNHLDVAPETKIIVVTHAEGIDFLMEGAKDPKNANIDYASLVSALKARVVRIGQLQNREHYAYIKP